MSYTITTGSHPGQPGACLAKYNHSTLQHSSHNPSQNPFTSHNHLVPPIQQPGTSYGYYGNPSWRPPGASYPFYY
ncbi:hypothetical protein [Neobacillus drentensis]|uniref:hypothetical protein n=1 Tax=Neobacillus drentensis TaxID=220684 RepID=UPI002FFF6E07